MDVERLQLAQIGSVNGPGPSSNVSATRPLRDGRRDALDVLPAHEKIGPSPRIAAAARWLGAAAAS